MKNKGIVCLLLAVLLCASAATGSGCQKKTPAEPANSPTSSAYASPPSSAPSAIQTPDAGKLGETLDTAEDEASLLPSAETPDPTGNSPEDATSDGWYCGVGIAFPYEDNTTSEETPPVGEKDLEDPAPFVEKEGGNLYFSANLLSKMYRNGENLFLSPMSIQQALGLTANGAKGETLSQLLQAFGADSLETLNQRNRHAHDLLRQTPGYFTLANSLWTAENVVCKPDFLQTARETYEASCENLYRNGDNLQRINQWIADRTGNLIPHMLDELDPFCRLLIVNTLLFDGEWTYDFDANNTRPDVFHGPQGDQTIDFMHQTIEGMPWYEEEGLSAVRLPYKDRHTAMLLVLPEQIDGFMSSLTPADLQRLIAGAEQGIDADVSITMPKFSLSCSARDSLKDALQRLGIQNAFDQNSADFGNMTETENLFIGDIQHNTVLRVGEEGTKAGAATVIEFLPGCPMPVDRPYKRLVLDRPFFCAIYDRDTGAVYFAGAVCQPDSF